MTFLAALFPPACAYHSPAGHHAHHEHRQHHEHHELADEQAPEQPVSGELARRCAWPGGGHVVRGRRQPAHRQWGLGEGDALRPGAVREQSGQAGGRPDEDRQPEQEAQQADQQAVRDTAGAAGARSGLLFCASRHVMPPLTRTTRSVVAGARCVPRAAPPPAPRLVRPPAGDLRPRTRSWRGRCRRGGVRLR